MKNIKNHTLWGKLLLAVLLVLSASSFISCSDNDNDKDDEQKQYLIGQLTQSKDGLEYLIDYSDFGYKKGQYPIGSKDLLTGDLDETTQLIDDLNHTNYGLSEVQAKVDAAITKANASIEAFKATKITETLYNQDTIDKLTVLQNKKVELLNLRDNSTYGNYTGQYPVDSKEILQTGIDVLSDLIDEIEDFVIVNPSQSDIDAAIASATTSVAEFEATVRTVDNIVYNLFVSGNSGGYIDFGYSDDYIQFGTSGDQAFTIEMWVNIKDYCNKDGEDNSTFLSTFAQKDGTGEFFSGWRVQSRTKNLIRGSVGVFDNTNSNWRDVWEPAYSYSNTNEWIHVTFVYRDKGLGGHSNIRALVYENGIASTNKIDISETERVYNSQDAIAKGMKMTAFGRLDGTTMKEYFNGSIKKMRIWKVAKDEPYIKASYNGSNTIDSTDPDLVCAWDFQTKPTSGNTILDLTGRHTATLVGSHQWVEAE